MAIRFKKAGPRRRTHIADWRRYRNLTQDQLAEKLGTSKPTISRYENARIPYNQDFIEACSKVLGCSAGDLIDRDPRSQDVLTEMCGRVPAAQRAAAAEMIGVLIRATDAPELEPAAAKRGRR